VVGEYDRLKQLIVVSCFFDLCWWCWKIVADFSMGVLVYFYFLFGVILGILSIFVYNIFFHSKKKRSNFLIENFKNPIGNEKYI